MAQINLIVSVNDDHLQKLEQVAKALKKKGMSIDNVLEAVGVITGSVEEEKLSGLKSVAGVAHVEKEQSFQLAPPESDVQ